MPLFFRRSGGVAVVEMFGVIGNHIRVPAYARLLDSLAESKRYCAVVLDIDSPGGSASGSEVLFHSLKKVADSKPVVAYVRGIGASGGYYLACAASNVVALPTALVGSIGVIYLRPILEQLLGKAGVEFSVIKGGRLKDMGAFWRGPTPEEEEKFQTLINEIYDNFVSVVANGRSMSQDQVRELATGEVFTARRGIDLGLVDKIGDFNSAVALAAQLGNTKPRVRWVRPRRGLGQRFFGRMGGGDSSLSFLSSQLKQLMAGGIYYLEPSFMAGEYMNNED